MLDWAALGARDAWEGLQAALSRVTAPAGTKVKGTSSAAGISSTVDGNGNGRDGGTPDLRLPPSLAAGIPATAAQDQDPYVWYTPEDDRHAGLVYRGSQLRLRAALHRRVTYSC